jgi:hypothetical protein
MILRGLKYIDDMDRAISLSPTLHTPVAHMRPIQTGLAMNEGHWHLRTSPHDCDPIGWDSQIFIPDTFTISGPEETHKS